MLNRRGLAISETIEEKETEAFELDSYTLPVNERIQLMEQNIQIFEKHQCISRVQQLRNQLSVLRKDQADQVNRCRHW